MKGKKIKFQETFDNATGFSLIDANKNREGKPFIDDSGREVDNTFVIYTDDECVSYASCCPGSGDILVTTVSADDCISFCFSAPGIDLLSQFSSKINNEFLIKVKNSQYPEELLGAVNLDEVDTVLREEGIDIHSTYFSLRKVVARQENGSLVPGTYYILKEPSNVVSVFKAISEYRVAPIYASDSFPSDDVLFSDFWLAASIANCEIYQVPIESTKLSGVENSFSGIQNEIVSPLDYRVELSRINGDQDTYEFLSEAISITENLNKRYLQRKQKIGESNFTFDKNDSREYIRCLTGLDIEIRECLKKYAESSRNVSEDSYIISIKKKQLIESIDRLRKTLLRAREIRN